MENLTFCTEVFENRFQKKLQLNYELLKDKKENTSYFFVNIIHR